MIRELGRALCRDTLGRTSRGQPLTEGEVKVKAVRGFRKQVLEAIGEVEVKHVERLAASTALDIPVDCTNAF